MPCAKRSQLLLASATSAQQPGPSATQLPEVPIPASQQEAISAACKCLIPPLRPFLAKTPRPAKTAKGFSGSKLSAAASNRFAVEIPAGDTSAQGLVLLTGMVLDELAAQLKAQQGGGGAAAAAALAPGQVTVVHAREDALAAAKGRSGGRPVLGLQDACRQASLGGILVVVEPGISDVALLEQLVDEVWSGPAVLVLNPGWSQGDGLAAVPRGYAGLVDSFDVVYSFLPCAIQGLLGPKQGAVMRTGEAGSSKAPWRILYLLDDKFVQVGAMPRRPSPDDLQLAFINASAATSPLANTARFLKGLMPQKKDKQ